mmetsp:Transcript_29473/g.44961  ORF Transcript_29473/g.44961 Transcript_29473/m.44961 type:complete len:128 (+) Transcript_29473:32-415(+)
MKLVNDYLSEEEVKTPRRKSKDYRRSRRKRAGRNVHLNLGTVYEEALSVEKPRRNSSLKIMVAIMLSVALLGFPYTNGASMSRSYRRLQETASSYYQKAFQKHHDAYFRRLAAAQSEEQKRWLRRND